MNLIKINLKDTEIKLKRRIQVNLFCVEHRISDKERIRNKTQNLIFYNFFLSARLLAFLVIYIMSFRLNKCLHLIIIKINQMKKIRNNNNNKKQYILINSILLVLKNLLFVYLKFFFIRFYQIISIEKY